jgi:hypothetical protein
MMTVQIRVNWRIIDRMVDTAKILAFSMAIGLCTIPVGTFCLAQEMLHNEELGLQPDWLMFALFIFNGTVWAYIGSLIVIMVGQKYADDIWSWRDFYASVMLNFKCPLFPDTINLHTTAVVANALHLVPCATKRADLFFLVYGAVLAISGCVAAAIALNCVTIINKRSIEDKP